MPFKIEHSRLTKGSPVGPRYLFFFVVLITLTTCQSSQRTSEVNDEMTFSTAGLKTLAPHNLLIGSSIGTPRLNQDPNYWALLRHEFNVVTLENELKMPWVKAQKDQAYDFSAADALLNYAVQNSLKVRGHTLVWYLSRWGTPDWVEHGNLLPSELERILIEHITTVMGHVKTKFPGTMISWDVVNEAMDDNGELRANSVWSSIGNNREAHIALAFRTARAADPNVKLFYNDYNIEGEGLKSNAVFSMIKRFRESGVPIDGVGFQSHFDRGDVPSYEELVRNMQRFADLGLEVHITELDDRLTASPAPSLADLHMQADVYGRVLKACRAVPACRAFVVWGFTDRYSWIPSFFPDFGHACIFDEQLQPKPAYDAVASGLR